jgi:hypothetical protein
MKFSLSSDIQIHQLLILNDIWVMRLYSWSMSSYIRQGMAWGEHALVLDVEGGIAVRLS